MPEPKPSLDLTVEICDIEYSYPPHDKLIVDKFHKDIQISALNVSLPDEYLEDESSDIVHRFINARTVVCGLLGRMAFSLVDPMMRTASVHRCLDPKSQHGCIYGLAIENAIISRVLDRDYLEKFGPWPRTGREDHCGIQAFGIAKPSYELDLNPTLCVTVPTTKLELWEGTVRSLIDHLSQP